MNSHAERVLAAEAVKEGLLTKPQAQQVLKILGEKGRAGAVASFAAICTDKGLAPAEKLAECARKQNVHEALLEEDTLYGEIALENDLIESERLKSATETVSQHLDQGSVVRVYEQLSTAGLVQKKMHAAIAGKISEVRKANKEGAKPDLIIDDTEDLALKVELAEAAVPQQESDLWSVKLEAEGRELSRLSGEAIEGLIYSGRLKPTDMITRSFEPSWSPANMTPGFMRLFPEEKSGKGGGFRIDARIPILAGAVIVVIVGIFIIVSLNRGGGGESAAVGLIAEIEDEVAAAERLIDRGSRLNPGPWRVAEKKMVGAKARIRGLRSDPNVKGDLEAVSAEVDRLLKSDELAHMLRGEFYLEETGEWLKKTDYDKRVDELEIKRRRALGYKYLKRAGYREVDNWLPPDEYDRLSGKIDFGGKLVFAEEAATQIIKADERAFAPVSGGAVIPPPKGLCAELRAGTSLGAFVDRVVKAISENTREFTRVIASSTRVIDAFFEDYDHTSNATPISDRKHSKLRDLSARNKEFDKHIAAGKVFVEDKWYTREGLVSVVAKKYGLVRRKGDWVPECMVPFYIDEFPGIPEKTYVVRFNDRVDIACARYEYDGDYINVYVKAGTKMPMQFPRSSVEGVDEKANEAFEVLSAVSTHPLTSAAPFIKAFNRAKELELRDWLPRIGKVINFLDPNYRVADVAKEEELKALYERVKHRFVCVDGLFCPVPKINYGKDSPNDGKRYPRDYEETLKGYYKGQYDRIEELDDLIKKLSKEIAGSSSSEQIKKMEERDKLKKEKAELEKTVKSELKALTTKCKAAWKRGLPHVGAGAFGGINSFHVREAETRGNIVIDEVHIPNPLGREDSVVKACDIRLLGFDEMCHTGATRKFSKPFGIVIFAEGGFDYRITRDYGDTTGGQVEAVFTYIAVPLELVRRGLSYPDFLVLIEKYPEVAREY